MPYWIEIVIHALIVVLLLVNLIAVVQVGKWLSGIIITMRNDVRSIDREVRGDIREVREDIKEIHIETSRTLAAARKAVQDDLDTIYDVINKVSKPKSEEAEG